MNPYLLTGIVLSISSGSCIVIFGFQIYRHNRKRPAYLKRLPKTIYQGNLVEVIWGSYRACGTIGGMLTLTADKYPDGRVKKRFLAARSYLKESRYKDFETALYVYASDGTEKFDAVFEKIIEREAMKRRGLPVHRQQLNNKKNQKEGI